MSSKEKVRTGERYGAIASRTYLGDLLPRGHNQCQHSGDQCWVSRNVGRGAYSSGERLREDERGMRCDGMWNEMKQGYRVTMLDRNEQLQRS